MPQARFYIKDDTAKESVIMVDFAYNNRRLRASSELVTSPEKFSKVWSAAKKCLNSKLAHWPEYQHLERVKTLIEEAYKKARAEGNIPTPDALKEHLRLKLNQVVLSPAEKEASFVDRFNQFIAHKRTTQKPASVVVYQQILNDLVDFAAQRKKPLSFEDIDMEFYDAYINYLLNRPNTNANCKNKVGLLNDSIAKRISNLKMFMRWAKERGYHQGNAFEKFAAKRTQKHEIVVLNEQELDAIIKLDLSKHLSLARVRDLFIFGTFTGQRWGDVEAFQAEQVQDLNTARPIWVFVAEKTQKLTRVPLVGFCSPALEVLRRYEFNLPKISGQKFNKYIKEVCKLAEINQPVVLRRYSGKKLVEIKKPKYEFISSHCCRRSLVSLLLQKGVPPTTIMKITQHSDLKTFMKYESTSDDAVIAALERVI